MPHVVPLQDRGRRGDVARTPATANRPVAGRKSRRRCPPGSRPPSPQNRVHRSRSRHQARTSSPSRRSAGALSPHLVVSTLGIGMPTNATVLVLVATLAVFALSGVLVLVTYK